MIRYMRRHERGLKAALAERPGGSDLARLIASHDRRITWMQHERLVHLLVTLFVCLFALLAVGFAVLRPSLAASLLAALLAVLSAAYLVHYYRLENGVQRWYRLADEMRRRAEGR